MRYIRIIYCFFVVVFWALPAAAQPQVTPRAYRLDVQAGLPTNHVYGLREDRLGYLWMATPKGAVRYNGYKPVVFDATYGLANEDVWYTFEDSSGRIWLSAISKEYGYLKNDRYVPAFQAAGNMLFYPIYVQSYNDGIVFAGPNNAQAGRTAIDVFTYHNGVPTHFRHGLNSDYRVYLTENAGIVSISKNQVIALPDIGNMRYKKRLRNVDPGDYQEKFYSNMSAFFNKYEYTLDIDRQSLWVLNIFDNRPIYNAAPKMERPDEQMIYAYPIGSLLYVISTHNAYTLNTNLEVVSRRSIATLTGGEKTYDTKEMVYNKLSFWGESLCTMDNGVYMPNASGRYFVPWRETDMSAYTYVGAINDSTGCWWNDQENKLLRLVNGRPGGSVTLRGISNVKSLQPYDAQRSVLTDEYHVYWMDNATMACTPFFADASQQASKLMPGSMYVLHPDTLLGIFSGSHNFQIVALGKPFNYTQKWQYKFSGFAYDKRRNGVWLYNYRHLAYQDLRTGATTILENDHLQQLGIRRIEKILVDPHYGNVFLVDYDKIWMFTTTRGLVPVATTYRYTYAQTLIHNDRLISVGKFGALVTPITGCEQLQEPVWYENAKAVNYSTVSDVQPFPESLLIKTNSGMYRLPYSNLPEKADRNRIRYIVSTADTAMRVRTNDTVALARNTPGLSLDVINPGGVGALQIRYREPGGNGQWRELNSGELSMAGLNRGVYHTYAIRAADDIWQGEPLLLTIYLTPYWWESPTALRVFGVLAVLLLIGAGVALVLVTRLVVNRRHAQKQMRMALELKALYAQINPHFIFNTLGTAQYYIKSNQSTQAYSHIQRFSRLLRNTLRSSQNKFVTIQHEVESLKDYIELQQTRFANKFDYEIALDTATDPQQQIPSLLLQPIVENAIQHGLLNKPEKGLLRIAFASPVSGMLQIEIEDDGIGRKMAREMRTGNELKPESYGGDLVNNLIHIFNTYEDIKIDIAYIDKQKPHTGTLVRITLHTPVQ